MYDNKQCQQRNCLVQVMPELLPAPPRAIATLAVAWLGMVVDGGGK